VVHLDKRHKVGLVVVHRDVVALKTNDRDPVAEVLHEERNFEAENCAWA
jgi:hypothetical protein